MASKLYVGNVPFQMSEDDLFNLFNSIGDVTSIKIPTDRDTNRPRGFAFVEMASPEDAETAIANLNGKDLNGRKINVTEAVERDRSSTPSNRPYAKDVGTGDCSICNTKGVTLYGFDSSEIAICASCISSLSKASKPRDSRRY